MKTTARYSGLFLTYFPVSEGYKRSLLQHWRGHTGLVMMDLLYTWCQMYRCGIGGRIVRAKRMVVAANPTEFEYLEGSIPSEWDAWIRGRRKQPPSIEELVKNQNYREHIKIKAREVEEKEQALQAKEYEEGLVAGPAQTIAKGHAAATSFGQPVTSEEPVSTANTFQPGSWSPTAKK
ncbi:NADH dehydrogenase [ubiquinone] 1 alpha subcomplex assembly factor 2 isoform X2 [Esox lucius]|uniref:NADH dehydrogenase [ubiquinone] 1 alpha subcomplex assembly factor 2 isoform X2 n=1 Tax=Esox lucius TaxID=8010 RepID=UPI0014619100|nr:NADH dehydrogenase [ubiquinone] 1 alpha subcomplex assembly factor 2 isoform X2 [Esox lucius]